MVEADNTKTERSSLPRWGMPIVVGILVAGGTYWFLSHRASEVESPPPPVVAQGTAFDVPASKEQRALAASPEPVRPEEASSTPVDAAHAPKSVLAPVPVASLVPEVVVNESKAPEQNGRSKSDLDKTTESKPTEHVVNAKPAEPKVESKAAEAKPDPNDGKAVIVPFSKLAFRYWPQVKGGRDPFPAEIRKLDGRKVVIEGFMMPIDFDKGKIQSFLLTKSMMGCCYADSFQITDVIKVQRADGKPVSFLSMAKVTGTLEVGEEKDSEGYIESVYRIKLDDLAPALFGK